MASVSGLTIKRQTGSSAYYATRDFESSISQSTGGGVNEGDWDTKNDDAT